LPRRIPPQCASLQQFGRKNADMTTELKKGDHVAWNTSQGETHGVVEQKITGTATVKGHTAKASPDEPQYKVKSDKTGKEAIHKPEQLHKT
jgi:hypothetical protein